METALKVLFSAAIQSRSLPFSGLTRPTASFPPPSWIDGYFEATKLARLCVGDRVEAKLLGFRAPIIGRIGTVTRGISVSDATPSTQGLPNVNAVYTWCALPSAYRFAYTSRGFRRVFR
jgi:hypothetical protein